MRFNNLIQKRNFGKVFLLPFLIFVSLAFFQSGLVSADCPPDFISYWSHDENYTEGGTSLDFYLENDGNINGMNDGSLNGGVTQGVAGRIGNAYSFDGSDDYVEVPDDASLRFDNGDKFTAQAWVNFDTFDTGSIDHYTWISKGNFGLSNGNYQFGWHGNDNALKFTHKEGGNWYDTLDTSGFTPSTNTWYHIVIVVDADNNEVSFYVNGELKSTVSNSDLDTLTSTEQERFLIGGRLNNGFQEAVNGKIDEVRIYDRALSEEEIEGLYNATDHTVVRDELIAEYRMEETSGSTAYDTSYIQSGQVNEAYDFDGEDDYVEIPDDDSLDFGSGNFAISVWSKTSWESDNYQQFINKYLGGHDGWYLGLDFNQEPIWKAGDGDNIAVRYSQDYADGEWHHYVGMRDGDELILFIDGEQVGTADFSGVGDVDTSEDLILGTNADASKNFYGGKLDEVAIWDRALSESEIQKIYDRSNDPSNKYYCNSKANLTWVEPTEDIYVAKNKFWNYSLKATCPEIGPPCGKIDVTLDPEEAEKLKEGKKLQVSGGEVTGVAGNEEGTEDKENKKGKEKGFWEKITGFFVNLFKSGEGGKNEQ